MTALDSADQVVTDFADGVHVTSSDAAAGLPTGSFPLSSGVASFTAILRTAGTQTLTVTDSSSPSITGTTTVPVP